MTRGLEKIKSKEKLLAIVIRQGFGNEGIHFLTEPEDAFQVGVLNHPQGYKVAPHAHRRILKKNDANQEFIFVLSGEVEANFYDGQELIKTTILRGGDALLQMEGGHGFKVLKPAKMIEVKQGPYYGVEKEKEYIKG